MKNSLNLIGRVLCLAVLMLALLLLTACGGGGDCLHRDADDDYLCDLCLEDFDDGSDICVHRDTDDDNVCDKCYEKYSDGPDIPDDGNGNGSGNGGSGTSNEADMSLVDVNKFYVDFNLTGIEFASEPLLDAYTANMFIGEFEFYLGYEGSDSQWLRESASAPISVDKERVTNDMSFLATATEAAELISLYLDQLSDSSIESSIGSIIRFAAGKRPSDEQLESFIDDVFGPDEFRALVNSTLSGGFDIASAEEIGYNDFVYREPVKLSNRIEGNGNRGRFEWMNYIPLSYFKDEQIAVEYCVGEEYYEAIYSFDLAEHLEVLDGKGLTVSDDGILINDAFFNAFDSGFTINDELALEDGTTQIVSYMLGLYSIYIEYDIEAPETVSAELDFENGVSVTFDVKVADLSYTVTVNNHVYGDIGPSAYIGQVSDWLKKCGEPKSSVATELVMLAPDSATFVASGVPVSEYEFTDNLIELGEFIFTYGERSTVLKNGVNTQMGVGFDRLIRNLCVPDDDAEPSLLMHMLYNNSTYVASQTPYTISCVTKPNDETEQFPVTVNIQLESVISGIALVDKNCITKSYYIGDELEIAYGSMLNVYRKSTFRVDNNATIDETVPVTADMIEGFDSSEELESGYMYVVYKGYTTNGINYQIKRDFVTSIDVKLPAWGMDVYVVGLRLNIDDVTINAYYDSGRDVEDIPLTMDMLSELPTSTGLHSLTVTYEGKTDEIPLEVVKASKASIYDGLGQYYLLGEKPGSVEVRVDFEPNQFGYDYDIVVLGAEELLSFDTASAGSKSWTFSWAGVSVSHSYEVVEKAYVGYTPSDAGITINGVFLNEAPEYYYELTGFAELNIPAKIGDVPVVAIGYGAFAGLNMINKLTVAEGIVSIGDYAFRDASGLVEVHLPQSATSIGKKIFSGCTALEKMYISGDKRVIDYFNNDIGENLTVYVNEGEDTICADFLTLNDDMRLSKVVLPSTLTTITTNEDSSEFWAMYYLCQYVLTFEVTPGGVYTSQDGVLFADNGKTLMCYPFSKTDSNYTVPDGVERIVFMAYNNNLKEVTVPASVKTLGENVFMRNEQMSSVTLLGTLDALPKGCFDGCESLVSFTLPSTLKSIGDTCFAYTKIPTIIVPDSVTHIGYDAFRQCSVQKLAIPKSAMESFKQLGNQTLLSLTDFAYDGSVELSKLDAIKYDFNKIAPKLANIYVYGTTSFTGGICSSTYTPFNVYIDSSVTSIGYGIEQSSGYYAVKYYYAGPSSSLSNDCNLTPICNYSFSKWYLG